MIKNFCKSDTTNGHHSNRCQALSQFVILGKKWFKSIKKINMETRDPPSYKNGHMCLTLHAKSVQILYTLKYFISTNSLSTSSAFYSNNHYN